MVWEGRPSIYEHIRRHCRAGISGLSDGGPPFLMKIVLNSNQNFDGHRERWTVFSPITWDLPTTREQSRKPFN